MKLTITLATATGLLALHGAALACSFEPQVEHEVDASLAATDTQAPSAPAVTATRIGRGIGPMSDGCSSSATSCDDIGTVELVVTPSTDDQAAPADIGYQMTLAAGTLPGGIGLPEGPVRLNSGSTLFLSWLDGAQDDQEPINFTLEIFPVDTAGNVGEPVSVTVSDPGSSDGCQSGPGAPGPLAPLLLLLLGLALRRRASA